MCIYKNKNGQQVSAQRYWDGTSARFGYTPTQPKEVEMPKIDVFQNTAEMHPQDITQNLCKLRVMFADHGLPDLLAMLANVLETQNDLGLPEIREVLNVRAKQLRNVAKRIR